MPASDAAARHQEGESAMDFGIHFGTRGCLASRDNIIALAQRAEALGYGYLGVADHLVVPVQSGVRYPYTADGIWPGAPTGECFDAIATLAFLAACTQHIKLLTSVAVVPYRPAVLAAKLFLTADVLSEGRVIAGVGSGWMREEFEALGTPPYAERGAVTDEYLTAWKTLWTAQRPTLHGTYTKFENMMFEPKPTSKPHPPIWVGGESPPALRRVAQFGDAWYPVSNNQQIRLNTPERLKDGIAGMRRVVEKAGRDPLSVDVGYLWFLPPNEIAQTGPDGERQLFTGSAADWQEDAASLAEAGARHVILYLQRPTIGETLDVMQRVSEAVVHN
jgi:probable F420-dependent oxidoreductase